LPLQAHGLEWIFPEASVAHPFDNQPPVLLSSSIEETARQLGRDYQVWVDLFTPFVNQPERIIRCLLNPLGELSEPLLLARLGLNGMWPATLFCASKFKEERTKALFAGCAAHSILPLNKPFTAAVGLAFLIAGQLVNWPVAKGGSGNITKALESYFKSLGGEILTSSPIDAHQQLPPARAYLFDTDPWQVATIMQEKLPATYRRRLLSFRFGPGVCKVDWALNGAIPWRDSECLKATTVHLGATMKEIAIGERAAWNGQYVTTPWVLLAQQSQFDAGRAPGGYHTGWAYCHVPHNSPIDATDYIERQIERFAPGFKERIIARRTTRATDFVRINRNRVGGAPAGGPTDIRQLFTRPVARLDPYSTPNPQIFICSASTPPGGGVHGMNGFYAAASAIRYLTGSRQTKL
jgi:phytoene dehydrogenase-like protein